LGSIFLVVGGREQGVAAQMIIDELPERSIPSVASASLQIGAIFQEQATTPEGDTRRLTEGFDELDLLDRSRAQPVIEAQPSESEPEFLSEQRKTVQEGERVG